LVVHRCVSLDGEELYTLEYESASTVSLINPDTFRFARLSAGAKRIWRLAVLGTQPGKTYDLLARLQGSGLLTTSLSAPATAARPSSISMRHRHQWYEKNGQVGPFPGVDLYEIAFGRKFQPRCSNHPVSDYGRALFAGRRVGRLLMDGARLASLGRVLWGGNGGEPSDAGDVKCAIRDANYMRFALRVIAGPMTCIQESMTILHALSRLGHGAEVIIGHEKTGLGTKTPLHAWAEVDGNPVNECREFRVLYDVVAAIQTAYGNGRS
jgi:transglutaminase superfamily protein